VRLIKMFGLAAIAVGALMAFVGATSASAITSLEEVVVCKEDKMLAAAGCPAAQQLPSGTAIDGQLEAGSTAQLLSNLGTVKCNQSTTSGETSSSLAHGLITAVTFNNNGGKCLLGGSTECEITTEHKPYLVLVLLITGHEEYHAVVSEHGTNGKPRALVDCGSSALKCFFGHVEFLFTVELKAEDTVWTINQELEREGGSGFLCPSTSTWQAKYLVRCLKSNHTEFQPCWPAMHENVKL
jgi:hypothetical protein